MATIPLLSGSTPGPGKHPLSGVALVLGTTSTTLGAIEPGVVERLDGVFTQLRATIWNIVELHWKYRHSAAATKTIAFTDSTLTGSTTGQRRHGHRAADRTHPGHDLAMWLWTST